MQGDEGALCPGSSSRVCAKTLNPKPREGVCCGDFGVMFDRLCQGIRIEGMCPDVRAARTACTHPWWVNVQGTRFRVPNRGPPAPHAATTGGWTFLGLGSRFLMEGRSHRMQPPGVDERHLKQLVDGEAVVERLAKHDEAVGVGHAQAQHQLLPRQLLVVGRKVPAVEAGLHAAHRLLE
eukprot:49272-Chlamydomonas_euryale.AAC.4